MPFEGSRTLRRTLECLTRGNSPGRSRVYLWTGCHICRDKTHAEPQLVFVVSLSEEVGVEARAIIGRIRGNLEGMASV